MNVEKVLLNIFYIQNSRMQHLGSFKSTARLSLNLFEHTCQKSKLLEQRTKAEFKSMAVPLFTVKSARNLRERGGVH